MIVYTKRQLQRLLKIDFIRFCMVGGTGFMINVTLLALFTKFLHAPVFTAQFVGAEVALFSNFMLHHHWTYRHNHVDKSFNKLVLQFHLSSWPAIVGSTLMVSFGVGILGMDKYVALVASSAVALFWNFAWSKYIIWRDIGQKEIEEIVA